MTCKFWSDVTKVMEILTERKRYPPKMIPGFHVTVHTTATNDRDGRLLLSALGIPFYGKQIN
jgi:large subunit ribosomal protein L5